MPSDFDNAWRAYRKVRRGFVIAIGAWFGLSALCVSLLPFPPWGPWLFEAVVFALFPLAIAFSLWHSFWPCPRCRKPFFTTWTMGVPYSKYCLHCGLKKWDLGHIPLERHGPMKSNFDERRGRIGAIHLIVRPSPEF